MRFKIREGILIFYYSIINSSNGREMQSFLKYTLYLKLIIISILGISD